MLDVDSTLINEEVIDQLALLADFGEQVAEITSRAMAGELDFATALHSRVALLRGQSTRILDEVRENLTFTEGAEELITTLKAHNWKVGLVSGGFEEIIRPLTQHLDIDFLRANHFETVDGLLTGRTEGEIVGRKEKAEALREFADGEGIDLRATVAVGDGANDLEMIRLAGLGIAFCAKPVLIKEANLSIDKRDLRLLLPYLL